MTASAVHTLVRLHLVCYWLTLGTLLVGVLLGALLVGQPRPQERWLGALLALVSLWAIIVLPFRPLAAVLPEVVWRKDVPFLVWTAVTIILVWVRYGQLARATARRWWQLLLADTSSQPPE